MRAVWEIGGAIAGYASAAWLIAERTYYHWKARRDGF